LQSGGPGAAEMFVARSRLFSTLVEAVSRFKVQHSSDPWLTRHGLGGMAHEQGLWAAGNRGRAALQRRV